MRTTYILAPTCITALIWSASGAFASDARFPFNLPNCPTTLVLSAPDIFAGAENQQELVKQIAASPIASDAGTVVQALIAPREPSVVLVLAERKDVIDIQGSATKGQFDRLKANLLAANGQSEVAQVNERGRKDGAHVDNFSIVSTTSNETSVTIIGVMNGTAPSADFASYLGVSVGYAQQCIPAAIVVAPKSIMSKEAFEMLVRSLVFE